MEIGGETVGLITYMRTDGVDIDPPAVQEIRRVIGREYGDNYVPGAPRKYLVKAKNAQEAHEAIRPTDIGRLPKHVAKYLEPEQARLYELIWTRTIASQMESAQLERTTADILAAVGPRKLDLRATGQVIKFDGFLTLYNESKDDEAEEDEGRLPPMSKGDPLTRRRIVSTQHFTEPPPRFSEASLVKRMEELGIGRPSTYAAVLQVLRDREYVRIDKKRLVPEDKGRLVIAFLESFFRRYVEYDFTADLEEQLDRISNHEIDWKQVLRDFWRDFSAAIGETKDLRTTQVLDSPERTPRPAYLPRQGRRLEPAHLPDLRHGPALAEARKVRRLHRLLELSGMQVHPPARRDRRQWRGRGNLRERRPARRARPRRRSGERPAGDDPRRPLRSLRATRRRRKAQALVAAQGAFPGLDRPRDRAETARPAPRSRAAPGFGRADLGQHRALWSLCSARQGLRQYRQ